MAIVFTIAGSNKTSSVLDSAFSLDMSMGSDWTCTFQVKDVISTSSAYRPALDASVLVTLNGTDIFKGKVITVRDNPIVPPAKGTLTTVIARSSTVVTQQVIVNGVYPAGWTLKAVLQDFITTYLAAYGISLDPAMATGPTLEEQVFDQVTMQAALNHLTDITGWPWRLMPTDVLQMFSPGSKTTTYSLTNSNGNQLGPVTWEKTRTKFANRVTVRAGTETQVDKTETFTGNGSTSLYALSYPFIVSRGYVTVAGVAETFGPGATWDYVSASNSIQRTSNVANGDPISITYTAQFPISVSAEDSADIATNGVWAEVINAPDIFDRTAAQELATGLLRNRKQATKQVYLRTAAGPAYPGDTITATFSDRTVTGSHLITQVRASGRVDQRVEWALTCMAGSEGQRDWTEMLRSALGATASGSSGGGTISGSIIPNMSGIFPDDVISNSDQDDDTLGKWPVALTNWGNGSLFGPAVRLGRQDKDYGWAMVADTTAGSTPGTVPRLSFVPMLDSSTYRFAMQVSQDEVSPVPGQYYLTPNSNGALFLGAPTSSGFGPNFRVTGGYLTDLDVANGVLERSRPARMGDWTAYTPTRTTNAGTWTGGTVSCAYTEVGRTCFVRVIIDNSSLSGTPTILTLTVPETVLVSGDSRFIPLFFSGTWSNQGFVENVASTATIQIQRSTGAAFPTGAGLYIHHTFAFEF